MKNLYIAGAGGFGREVAALAENIKYLTDADWQICGFLDDTVAPLEGKACTYQVVGTIKDFSPGPDDLVTVALGEPQDKFQVANFLRNKNANFINLIHPYVPVNHFITLGEGVIIQGGCGLTVNIEVGSFASLLMCLIGHDVSIGAYSTISSYANISGHVTIGEQVHIGGNVAIAPNVTIGAKANLCMGSVILKDVSPGAKMLGNPAREIG